MILGGGRAKLNNLNVKNLQAFVSNPLLIPVFVLSYDFQ